MKNQKEGLNYTITQINNLKANIEKNFDVKYNEDKKEFEKEIKTGKLYIETLKKQLLKLLKELGLLSQMIIKKQAIKKTYEKWLAFQILVKDNIVIRSKKILTYMKKKYGNEPIFDNYSDFFSFF